MAYNIQGNSRRKDGQGNEGHDSRIGGKDGEIDQGSGESCEGPQIRGKEAE